VRLAFPCAIGTALVLAVSALASPQFTSTAALTFSSASPGSPSGLDVHAAWSDPGGVNGVPKSVTKMTFNICRVSNGTGMIRRARIKIASDTGFAGQAVTLYLYRDSPTLTNGDRGTWLTTESNYIGKIPVTLNNHFSDYEKGVGVPVDSNGNVTEINYDCNGTTGPTGLLVAGGTITPQAGSKAVTVVLEAITN